SSTLTIHHEQESGKVLDDAVRQLLLVLRLACGIGQCSFGFLAARDVDDGRQHERSAGGLDGRQADLYGNLASVLSPAEQISAHAHASGRRLREETTARIRVF